MGYKGLINDQVLIAIDGYWANKKNFTGPLLVESPLLYLQGVELLGADVGQALGTTFATSTDPVIQQLLQGLGLTGLNPTQVTQLSAGLVAGGLNNLFIGAVQPDQNVLPEGISSDEGVGAFLGYRKLW